MKSPERPPAPAGETSMNTEALLKERFLRPDEIARLFRIGRSTVYRWIKNGALPATKHKPYRVPASGVLKFMAENLRT